MANSFDLKLTVRHPDLVAWLESLAPDTRDMQVEQTLAIGHQVMTHIQAGSGEESMRRMFRPVTEVMDKLQGTLDRMMSFAQKSQRLGELGEATVLCQLQDAFPTDRFELVSDTGHQADVLAFFNLGDIEEPAIIEVKLYTNDVPSAELDKFRKDLREQRRRYGLMVSLTSRMTGIHGAFEVEARDGYMAVFVPSAGMDGLKVHWGAMLLKSMMLFEHRAGRKLQGEAIEQAWQNLRAEFAQLEEAAADVGRFRESIRRAQQKVNETLDGLVDQAIEAELRMKQLVQRLAARLVEELGQLPRTGPLALPAPAAPDAVEAFLDELASARDKRAPAFRALWKACLEADVAIALESGGWVLIRDGVRLAETTGSATRLDLKWHLPTEGEQTWLPSIETPKDGCVLINGKDPGALVTRLQERLAMSAQ